MSRLRFSPLWAALAAVVLAFAPGIGRADDETNKAAAEAQKQRADIQKQLAGGSDLQKRLRIDKFEAADQSVKVTGVFLDLPAAKADDPVPFDQVTDELFKSLREQLKMPMLKFDAKGITRIPPDQQPHVVLQLAANAAGAKGESAADECLFEGSRFGPTGTLIITGRRGKGDAVEKWIAAAIPTHLSKNPAVRLKDAKPDVTAEVKAVEWKLSAHALQQLLAGSGKADGTAEEKNRFALRRLLVDRAFFTYQVAKEEGKESTASLRFRIEGLRMGEGEVKVEWAQDAINPLVADAAGKMVPGDYGALVGTALEEPIKQLRTAVADHPNLDGVRIDPGFTFGPDGELVLAGVQPGLVADVLGELQRVVRAGFESFGRGKPLAAKYDKIAKQQVSVKAMTVLPLDKVKDGLNLWAKRTRDDLKFLRLYFPESVEALKKRHFVDAGGLVLLYRPAKAADVKDVETEFKRLLKAHLDTGVPPAPGAPDEEEVKQEPAEKEPLLPSLTAYLRKEMASNQKKWNGVLIERGYFDLDKKNQYTLLGGVDSARQNEELQKLLDSLKTDPKWAEYFTPEEPAKVALDVIPMSQMLERVRRVTPAYPVFDGIRIESAHYDDKGNLIFDAHVVGQLDRDAEPTLVKLLRDSPVYRRRVLSDRQVVIARIDGPAYSDDQLANFSMAYGAQLLAKAHKGKEDREKARTWLDVALLHYPNESGVWFLDAYYYFAIVKDEELTRRDLFRVIGLEGPLAFNGPAQRKRRYEAAKDLQGPVRNKLEALWLDCFREAKDGAKPITMTPAK